MICQDNETLLAIRLSPRSYLNRQVMRALFKS